MEAEVARAIVKEYILGISDGDIDYILWHKTGYPAFWGVSDQEACLRQQLQLLKDEKATRQIVKARIEGAMGRRLACPIGKWQLGDSLADFDG